MLLIKTCAMHQEIKKYRHQKDLCMPISTTYKHDAHVFPAKFT